MLRSEYTSVNLKPDGGTQSEHTVRSIFFLSVLLERSAAAVAAVDTHWEFSPHRRKVK